MQEILCVGACFWKEIHLWCHLIPAVIVLEYTDHFSPDTGRAENMLNESWTVSCVVGWEITTPHCKKSEMLQNVGSSK
jgi:hypothetical protein